MDQDLRSTQEARDLLVRANEASKSLAGMGQAEIDAIVRAMGEAAEGAASALARLAVGETGMGRYEDKVKKNLFSAVDVREYILPIKTCGIIGEDTILNVRELAVPMGVVAGLLPTTNPTSTAIYKALIAVKARNAIVFSPHPRATRCVLETVGILESAARSAGAPANIVQCLSVPTPEGTNELMHNRHTAVILATGGSAMVRAAYSSGKPAFGVGPGNAPAIVERTADVAKAVADVVTGKAFDNGLICAAENSLICDSPIHELVRAELGVQGALFVGGEDRHTLESTMRDPKTGGIDAGVIGQAAVDIAKKAGLKVPDDTRVLVVECDSVGPTEFFSREKLSPVLAFYVENGWEACCKRSIQLLEYGGIGHTLAIHSTDEHVIERFFVEKPAFRILVNTPAALGAIGATTGLPPALTLGPGTWGGSSTSDNITPLHLVNIKRLAFGRSMADIGVGSRGVRPSEGPSAGVVERRGERSVDTRRADSRCQAKEEDEEVRKPTATTDRLSGCTEKPMTPEDFDAIVSKVANLLSKREWVPSTVRPAPPQKPDAGLLPSWAGAAQALGDVAPPVGGKSKPSAYRPAYDSLTVAARAAAAGTGPAPLPGGVKRSVGDSRSSVAIPIAVSARHLHVTDEDFHTLFGPDEELTILRDISQPGQYAAEQQVRIVGPAGAIEAVRIVGPARSRTQVELAASDYRALGVNAPVRRSGDLAGSGAIRLEGPAGAIDLAEGAIVTARHLHLGPGCAKSLNLTDGDRVDLALGQGERRCTITNVLVRTGEKHATELHIDTDEAHAFGVADGDPVEIVDRKPRLGTKLDGKARRVLVTERDVNRIAAAGELLNAGGRYIVTPAAMDRAKALGIWRSRP